MTLAGIAAADAGLEIRVGRLGRENAATKSRRLLVEGRVCIRRVDGRGVLASVRGDSGAIRTVLYEHGWTCDCEYRGRCSHILAVASVVVVASIGSNERKETA